MRIEEKLISYGMEKRKRTADENLLQETIRKSKEAFWESESRRDTSWLEFLYQQAAYIRKRWWAAQGVTLAALWLILYLSDSSVYARRSMGVLTPCFGILLLPELWKNRTSGSMEVEEAACFNLRKIYAARLTLFGMADIFLLSVFFAVSACTIQVGIWDMMVQFVLPLTVTCAICFRSLSGGGNTSYFSPVACCLGWTAVWTLVILNDKIYDKISMPVWMGAILLSLLYLGYSIRRVCKYSFYGSGRKMGWR